MLFIYLIHQQKKLITKKTLHLLLNPLKKTKWKVVFLHSLVSIVNVESKQVVLNVKVADIHLLCVGESNFFIKIVPVLKRFLKYK